MSTDTTVLVITIVAALAGTVFTVAPVVPGTLFVIAGAIACGFVAGWHELPWWFWIVQVLLAVGYLLIDNAAQVLGVQRIGGSKHAMIGGTIGVFAGPIVLGFFIGPFALLVGPPVGAVAGTLIGEGWARSALDDYDPDVEPARQRPRFHHLGFGALVAFIGGTIAKLVIIGVQAVLLLVVAR